MADFVHTKLEEWGLEDWIERFRDEGIDEESLYCLEDEDIVGLIPRIGPRAKFKKELSLLRAELSIINQETADHCPQEHEDATEFTQVQPFTGVKRVDKGKRKLDLQYESNVWHLPANKRRLDTIFPGANILSKVKGNMAHVLEKLQDQDNTKFFTFLKNKINDLETDKRELVGVFGKTGAGKSSLINAIIEEKNLLPSGRINACTSVMIKVEANMNSLKYEAEIEFIKEEEWRDEVSSMLNFRKQNENIEDEDYRDLVNKLTALYGDEWEHKSPDELMDKKNFNKEIPEFLQRKKKTMSSESAPGLSEKIARYTRSDPKEEPGKEGRRWYWPLVKCVTVRVPQKSLLLQHVTLVDLPGIGDRNKSRDQMWKRLVGRCSTVWIVTDMNRAAAEKEPWEILENACSLMGNGGQCQQIHFICTKSDIIEDPDEYSADEVRALISENNKKAKEDVKKEFTQLNKVKKHFNADSFEVFTVSSKEFQKRKYLKPTETEIPNLQKFLQKLNDCHCESLNYVSGAHGILSLIQGARSRRVAGRNIEVCTALEETLRAGVHEIRQHMEEAHEAFERCLSEGVKKSRNSCDKDVESFLKPYEDGRGFHKILTCVVKNNGIYKPKKRNGKEMNLNTTLSSCLTDSIDEEFMKTFPNKEECGPFKGIINKFSLGTEKQRENPKCKGVELQLTFLETEEKKIKTKLIKIIRDRKKTIYNSLTEKIEENMQDCYKKVASIQGKGQLEKMRDALRMHVYHSKNIMFKNAKDYMLKKLKDLQEEILEELERTLMESIRISLKTDDYLIPDVSTELQMVTKHYDKLKEIQHQFAE